MVTTSSEARLGAIRLAWWRERLEELDEGKKPRAEPRLQAVASELLPRGVSGKQLSQLEDAWLPLLEPFPWSDAQVNGLNLRGRILFGIGARLLGATAQEGESSGALWSLVDGALHCSDAAAREMLIAAARRVDLPPKASRRLRPLTLLGAIALPSVRQPGSGVARGRAALRHRLTGRFPPVG